MNFVIHITSQNTSMNFFFISSRIAKTPVKECGTPLGVWFEEPPIFIVSLLIDDVSVL
jgi:hypothetical protein